MVVPTERPDASHETTVAIHTAENTAETLTQRYTSVRRNALGRQLKLGKNWKKTTKNSSLSCMSTVN
jgi:hypothetical protein